MCFRPVRQYQQVEADLELLWGNPAALALCEGTGLKPGRLLGDKQQRNSAFGQFILRLYRQAIDRPQQHRLSSGQLLQLQLVPAGDLLQLILQDVTSLQQSATRLTRCQQREALVVEVSTRLAEAANETLDACLEQCLERIARYLDGDRVSIMLYSADQQSGCCNHEWRRADIPSLKNPLPVSGQVAPWWHRRMLAGEVILLNSLDELPPEAKAEKRLLEAHDTGSMVCIPLVLHGRTEGFMSIQAVGRTQTWNEEDIATLRALALTLMSVFQHRQDSYFLHRATLRLEGLRAVEGAMLQHLADEQPELAALRHLQQLIPCQRLAIVSLDASNETARVEGRFSEGRLEKLPGLTLSAGYLLETPLREGRPFYIAELTPDLAQVPAHLQLYEQGVRSLLLLPFHADQQLKGCLVLMAYEANFFTADYTEAALEVAGQLALVFYQRQLSQQLRKYTEGLEERVEERTRQISHLLGLQKAILQHAGIGIMATDQEGIIQLVNPALEKMIGYRAQELVGRVSPTQLRDPENVTELFQQLGDFLENTNLTGEKLILRYLHAHGTLQRECQLRQKNGGRLPVFSTISPLYDDQGDLTGYVNLVADISPLQQAQQELQVANQRLRLATQAAGQGIWEYNLLTGELFWDERMHQIHGTDSQNLTGMTGVLALMHPEDKALFEEAAAQWLAVQNEYQLASARIIRPDGRLIHTESLGVLVRDEAGRSVKLVGVVRDVTERKEAEQALFQSEEKFRQFAQEVDHIFWIHSAKTYELEFVNSAYERLSGQPVARLYADPFSYLPLVAPEHRGRVEKAAQAYFSGYPIDVEFSYYNQQGELAWVHLRSFIGHNPQGEPVRYFGIGRDITDQKAVEFRLRSALAQEQELNQLKSGFVSTVSHEFRTPLATIQSSVDLIRMYLEPQREQLPKGLNRHFGVISKEITKFGTLLSDILMLGRIESGKIKLAASDSSLLDICEEVLATHFSERSDDRQVELQVQGIPYKMVLDGKLISHVLVNLLSNAFKFSTGNPVLSLRFEPREVILSITDDGIGIPAEDIPRLFERFYRASNAGTVQGTGLGLVIAREFIELHGGTITVTSQPQKGTTFTIRLPLGLPG